MSFFRNVVPSPGCFPLRCVCNPSTLCVEVEQHCQITAAFSEACKNNVILQFSRSSLVVGNNDLSGLVQGARTRKVKPCLPHCLTTMLMCPLLNSTSRRVSWKQLGKELSIWQFCTYIIVCVAFHFAALAFLCSVSAASCQLRRASSSVVVTAHFTT